MPSYSIDYQENGGTLMKILPLVFVVAVAVAPSAQTQDTLDLTQPRGSSGPVTDAPMTGSASGISSHARREQSPVRLSLDWLDRNTYHVGEPFVFHVTLENVGATSVTLPWEPDVQQVLRSSDEPLSEALLTLDVDVQGGTLTVPIATLYGSSFSPGSTKVLRPGGRAEILAKGNWAFLGHGTSQLSPFAASPDVSVAARIHFLTSIDGHVYDALRSTNKVAILLAKRSGL
jgi:hypothetical protein